MSSHKPLISPLRYPGSKRRLVSYVRDVLKLNHMTPELYIEPFVGGGSVALQLMQEDLVKKVVLVDLDPWVASFWDVVFFDTDWLVTQIECIPVTLKRWEAFKKKNPTDKRTRALTCLFLNRTSFSGILEKKAGPLGGRAQESPYKIDCRFNRGLLIRRVREAAAHRDKVYAVWNCSWQEGLARVRARQRDGRLPRKDVFLYLDPPFFEKAEDLYRFCFEEAEHRRLRDYLLSLKDSWLLSYDSVQQVEKLYGDAIHKGTNGTNGHLVEIYYSLGISSERRRATEVILSNLPLLPIPRNSSRDRSRTETQPQLF